MLKQLIRKWAKWKYRKYKHDNVCCCGETVGEGGSICAHWGCRTQYDWAVTCEENRLFKILG